jgi:hypothetical protein
MQVTSMNNTEHARVRRLRRRANRLGAHGHRIVPRQHGSGARSKDGWQLIENQTNVLIAPQIKSDPLSLDEIEAAIERLEQAAEAP